MSKFSSPQSFWKFFKILWGRGLLKFRKSIPILFLWTLKMDRKRWLPTRLTNEWQKTVLKFSESQVKKFRYFWGQYWKFLKLSSSREPSFYQTEYWVSYEQTLGKKWVINLVIAKWVGISLECFTRILLGFLGLGEVGFPQGDRWGKRQGKVRQENFEF